MPQLRIRLLRLQKKSRFIIYTVLIVLFVFMALEIVSRLFIHFDEVEAEGRFAVNRDGYRDLNHDVEKPDNAFRILCVGDSTTYGHGLPFDHSFPALLAERLNEGKDGPYETILVAKKGWNTQQKFAGFQSALKYQPDLLLYQYELNDINWDFRSTSSSKLVRRIDQGLLSTVNFYSSIKFGYWLLSSSGKMFESLAQSYTEENPEWRATIDKLAEIASICRKNEITPIFFSPPILLDQEKAVSALDKLLDMAGEKAKQVGFAYLPLHRQMDLKPARDYRIYIFDLHPNLRCNELSVEHIDRFMREGGYLAPVTSRLRDASLGEGNIR